MILSCFQLLTQPRSGDSMVATIKFTEKSSARKWGTRHQSLSGRKATKDKKNGIGF